MKGGNAFIQYDCIFFCALSYVQAAVEATGETYELSRRDSISSLVFVLNILVSAFPILHMIIFSPKQQRRRVIQDLCKGAVEDKLEEQEENLKDELKEEFEGREDELKESAKGKLRELTPAARGDLEESTESIADIQQIQITEITSVDSQPSSAGVFPLPVSEQNVLEPTDASADAARVLDAVSVMQMSSPADVVQSMLSPTTENKGQKDGADISALGTGTKSDEAAKTSRSSTSQQDPSQKAGPKEHNPGKSGTGEHLPRKASTGEDQSSAGEDKPSTGEDQGAARRSSHGQAGAGEGVTGIAAELVHVTKKGQA